MRYELQCADGVGHPLEVVALSMCKVIHGIGVPLGTRTVVGGMDDAIDNRITEVHIRVCHVELGTENHTSFHGIWGIHLTEQTKVLFHGTVTIGRGHTRLCGRSLLLGNLLTCLLVNIRLAVLNHPDGKIPQLLEVVAGIIKVSPLESKPLDIV